MKAEERNDISYPTKSIVKLVYKARESRFRKGFEFLTGLPVERAGEFACVRIPRMGACRLHPLRRSLGSGS